MRNAQFTSSILSLALLATLSPSAHALLVSSAAVAFNPSNSIFSLQDGESPGTTSVSNQVLGTTTLSQFDPLLGVLLGARFKLDSTRTQTLTVTSTDGPNTGLTTTVTSSGTASATPNIVLPTGATTTLSTLTNVASCTGGRQGGCTGTPNEASTSTNVSINVSSGALDSLVGSGTVTATRRLSAFVTQQSTVFTGDETSTMALLWAGTMAYEYEYLMHAAPSFRADSSVLELVLNFGTLVVGDPGMLGFSLYNRAGARVGLDLDSIIPEAASSPFDLTLGPFQDLNAGHSGNWLALLDTSAPGGFSTSYRLAMSDADVGAESSRHSYEMTLRLVGSVVKAQAEQRVANVPEPATLVLLSVGLLAMAARRRERRG